MPAPDALTTQLTAHLATRPPVAAIYTDLDGTLLGRDGSFLHDADGRPSAVTATALVEALAAGVVVVAVSGRRAETLQDDARILGLDGAIAEAGTVLIGPDRSRTIRWGACPSDLAPTPRAAMAAAGVLDVVLERFAGDLRRYEPWDADRVGGYLLHGDPAVVDCDEADRLLAAAGAGWAKLIDNGASGGWEGRDVHAYHLLPRGVGKGPAVADDLARRGIDPAAAIAIGDSEEDATMADVVGTYVIVGNGHGEAGGSTFRVTGRNGAGVAEVVAAALATR